MNWVIANSIELNHYHPQMPFVVKPMDSLAVGKHIEGVSIRCKLAKTSTLLAASTLAYELGCSPFSPHAEKFDMMTSVVH
jgi:hypothetical protein